MKRPFTMVWRTREISWIERIKKERDFLLKSEIWRRAKAAKHSQKRLNKRRRARSFVPRRVGDDLADETGQRASERASEEKETLENAAGLVLNCEGK